jgi:uncharacterized protein with HEPN domain
MKKEPKIYLLHIIKAISAIEHHIQGINEEQFSENEVLQGFVERKLEVIGEATKRLPDELKKQYPTIPWADMAGMRNVIIHEYEDVDTNIVWDTVTQHLLAVKKQVENILKGFVNG